MLFALIPTLLIGLGLVFLLDGDDDTSEPAPAEELNLTRGDDFLDMIDTEATTVNAFEGNDTIVSNQIETDPITLRLGLGDDSVDLPGGEAEVLGRQGDDTVTMEEGSLFASLGLGNDLLESEFATVDALGGGGNDTMLGGAFDDTMDGGSGADSILGNEGDDQLFGNFGDDTLGGGDGADTLSGGQGDDSMEGGEGDDVMEGAIGRDTMDGGASDDIMTGGDGADSMTGGEGDDSMSGGEANDIMFGEEGDDDLNGGAGNDTVSGGGGSDYLVGFGGDDVIDSTDAVLPSGDTESGIADTVDGGFGDDLLRFDNLDLISGGEGTDSFELLVSDETEGPAIITDFEPATESLLLSIDATNSGLPNFDVTFQNSADGQSLEVLVGGVVVAQLNGLDTTDTIDVQTNVFVTLPAPVT